MNTSDCLNFLLKPGVHIIAGIATIPKKKLRDQNDKTCIFYLGDRSDRDHCDATIAERTVSIQSF